VKYELHVNVEETEVESRYKYPKWAYISHFGIGQRDFAAAVLSLHAAAVAAALQRQSVVVGLVAHVELLGIAVISGFKGVGALYCN
jgi:hypothetical protein